jgi:tetratricopeptide (TPR) repeat protein
VAPTTTVAPSNSASAPVKEPATESAPTVDVAAAPKPVEPKSAEVGYGQLMGRGDKLRETGRCGKAVLYYRKAARMEMLRPEPQVGLGWCYIDLEDFERGQAAFEQAVRLDGGFAEAYLGLGELFRYRVRSGETDQKLNGIKNYQKYLKLDPQGSEARTAEAGIRELKG